MAQKKQLCHHATRTGGGIDFPGRYPKVTVEELKQLWKKKNADGGGKEEVKKEGEEWKRKDVCSMERAGVVSKSVSPADVCSPLPAGPRNVQNWHPFYQISRLQTLDQASLGQTWTILGVFH